jgi:hypothetical protein
MGYDYKAIDKNDDVQFEIFILKDMKELFI